MTSSYNNSSSYSSSSYSSSTTTAPSSSSSSSSSSPNIYIPIRGSERYVSVSSDNLPSVKDVIEILRGEVAPLDIWLQIAIEYYKQNHIDDFKTLLGIALDPAAEEFYKDSKFERIAMLNAMASYYTQLGNVEKDKGKKEDYYQEATYRFTKADRIDPRQPLTFIGKAALLLAKGEVDRAALNFQQALSASSNTHNSNTSTTLPLFPAKLGYSCVLFNKGEINKAVESLQKLLIQNPVSASVRLGLGYCFYKLGKIEAAKKAFQRVLEIDLDNVDALVALATIHTNQGDIDTGMKLIVQAYELAPNNPIVLNQLANHFFYKGDYTKVHALAQAAMSNTDINQIKAEASYIIAKAYHATDKWNEALQNYHQATLKSPDFYLAQFGLGQVYLHNNDYEKAVGCFEAVLEKQPENYEALQILGSLYKVSSQSKNIEKIKNVLMKTTLLNPNDSSNWLELAQLLESSDVSSSLDAYEKGINLLKKDGIEISTEILNNMAVLNHRKGSFSNAEKLYLKVIEASGHKLEDFKAVNITTTYNLARLYESMNKFDQARQLYKGIIKEHPNYMDCYLRLGAIAKSEGNSYESGEWYKEALNIDPNSPETWSLYGALHLSNEQWNHAQKKFEQILEVVNKNDPYASIALANIYFNAKYQYPEKSEKYLSIAESFYSRILSRHNDNIYAANGLGMVAAAKNNLLLATEIFIQLRESAIDVSTISVNLAHVYMSRNLFDNAIKLYEGSLKKCNNTKDMEAIYGYLSKAYFLARRYQECKQILKKAIHFSPSNLALWYNLALAIESQSMAILEKPNKSLPEVASVNREVVYARHLLMNLVSQKTQKPNYDVKRCKTHLLSLTELAKKVGEELKSLEDLETENAKKRESAAVEAKKRADEREREEKEQEEAKKAKEEEHQRMAEEYRASWNAARADKEREEKDEDYGSAKKKKRGAEESSDEEYTVDKKEKKKAKKEKKKEKKEKRREKRDKKKKEKQQKEGKEGEEDDEEGEEKKSRDSSDQEENDQKDQEMDKQEEQKDTSKPSDTKDDDDDLFGSGDEL
ncbi:RNA polymerase II complex component [Cavenderia fasciculata]|uniref:RNA polymerase II complex component n=1 Tax=Cavenderia fasciculata TaxID=261658 RepID=F4Q3N8_CACFS|nr:RNA polymerase II complex component [Cavenderia fasciculata]EGG16854.1 RNA polymerase II complex component [Cavenderia fasciculata]|eukprot:XP_004355328.1 RNA polymerase II complex component [Cavenderia fasciculata]